MSSSLRLTTFDQVSLADTFFDSLKAQYKEFPSWFDKKSEAKEPVYVVDEDDSQSLRGFVYLKVEVGSIDDVEPPLAAARRLKVGTLKNEARGLSSVNASLKRFLTMHSRRGSTKSM